MQQERETKAVLCKKLERESMRAHFCSGNQSMQECVYRNDGEKVWKEKSIRFSVIRNVNISRVTKGSMRTNLTVCSATVRFMHLERTAAEILRLPQAEERTAQNVPYRTDRRIMKRLSKDMQKLQRW